jgi:inhibitor of cysteine peptidase
MHESEPYVSPQLNRKLLSELAKMLMKKDCSHSRLPAALLCSLLALTYVTPARAQTQPQTTQTVSLLPGASTTIVLPENPSTGFRWRLNTAQSTRLSIVRVLDRGYQAVRSGLIGAPGSHHWEIKARAPGVASVAFTYARPWEHKPPATIHFVEVNIWRR